MAGTVLSLCSFQSFSQQHLIQRPEHKWLQLAEEQYNQGHYRLAVQSAKNFLQPKYGNVPLVAVQEIERAKYFQTLASLQLDRPDGEDSALIFLAKTSNPVYKQRTSLLLAQYYFRHEELNKAIPYYENASISNLSNQEIADSKFELAYAYFNSRNFEKAEPLFASIKEVPGKYYLAGNYYYGLLAYNEGKYEEALKSFGRIDNEKQYHNIVPYYIAEIYYFMGERKKALEEAMRLIRRPDKLYYDNELHLLAAQVLFEEQRYGEALPYFEHYYENVDKIRKEELYEIGYSYYRVNEWKHAIEKFKPLSNTEDSLGQTAMYLLGDCYLKTGDKKSARNAFGICSDMPFNKKQQEAALLLYGKLSYEMGYNDVAITSFTSLINNFPSSSYRSEAKTLLSDLLIRTNKYADAFNALQDVQIRSNDYWKVEQKVTYGYAMQQIQNGNLRLADSLLALSLQQPTDRPYEAAALFWRGDIAYKQNRPEQAISFLRSFMSKTDNGSVTYLSPQASMANGYLNLGYAAMELQDYDAAKTYFEQARENADGSASVANNASAREADAAFMQKNYKEAASLYDKVIATNTTESDYARLQKGILLGLQGKTGDKISLLQEVMSKTPPSPYTNDARYELASTYIEADKYQQAITTLLPLTTDADARNYAAKAWMRIGFAHQAMDQDTKAIEAYKKIISDFPASEDRAAALDALRSLYIENNQPQAYADLLKTYNLPSAGSESLDSTYYATAEAQIASAKWAEAKTALATYLEKFPNGSFTTKAHYYKAESHYQLKEYEPALNEYSQVLSMPWNEFSESAAKRAAEIAYRTESYAQAINYYGLLRNNAITPENLQLAYSGLMRSSYNNNDFENASNYADTLLAMPDLSENIMQEVQFFKARSLQKADKNNEALAIFKTLQDAKTESIAAEARFRTAEIYFNQNDLKEAEAAAANAIKLNSGSDYWTVKSYLLISDILTKQKDYFNAKATLQSIIKNTKNAELKKEASQKLEDVKKLEKQQTKLRED
jgi:tetratricopeptide (TPR) repeat protein